MDDYNHMMEAEHSELAYQSQMMTSVNSTIENNVATVHSEFDEAQTGIDSQSVSVNNDETLETPTNDINIANDTSESTHQNDEQNIPVNEEDVADVTVPIDEINDKCENADETETIEKSDVKGEEIADENAEENDGEEKKVDEEENEVEHQDDDENEEKSNDRHESSPQLQELKKEEDEIDMNQCRVCTSSSNLLDIFRIGEKTSFRFCDLIMKLAPNVKISERDFLPHSICSVCVDRIEAAYLLRVQCEETDQMLRSKLKRSKKTTRRAPSEYLIIDAAAESSSDSDDDDQKSDDEFQISEESLESSDSDSDSSYDEKPKRIPQQRGWKRGPQKRTHQPVTQQQPAAKKSRNSGVVYIKADDFPPTKGHVVKQQPTKTTPTNRLAFRCEICNRPCSTAEAMAQHRKTHTDEKCSICSMVFKQRSALLQHMQRHKEDPDRVCQKCHRVFVTKAECQKHIHMAHPETIACNKCKRYFPNKAQLDAHKCVPAATADQRKPMDTNIKRKPDIESSGSASGRDLFKSVAPLTTTYWSDSFSD